MWIPLLRFQVNLSTKNRYVGEGSKTSSEGHQYQFIWTRSFSATTVSKLANPLLPDREFRSPPLTF